MSQFDFYRTFFDAKWSDRASHLDRINRVQQKRLRQLLTHAFQHVPFQKRRCRGRMVDDLKAIQPTDKLEMLESFVDTLDQVKIGRWGFSPDELCKILENPKSFPPWHKNRLLVSTTSGTTGQMGIVINSRNSWDRQRAAVFSRTCRGAIPVWRFNPWKPYRMAYAVIGDPWSVSYHAVLDSISSNSALAKIKMFHIENSMDELVQNIGKFKPDFLQSYPNYLELFADLQLNDRVFDSPPNVISSGGDLLSEQQRIKIKRAFPKSRIVNHYGATECLPLANTCQHGSLHLNSDYVVVELVDESDVPVPVGQFSSQILITNLLNFTQPFIRYRIPDTIRMLAQPCNCGSPLPVIEIKGRSYPLLHVSNNWDQNSSLEGTAILSAMLSVAGISKFQINYHRVNEIEITIFQKNSSTTNRPPERNSAGDPKQAVHSAMMRLLAVNVCDRSVRVSVKLLTDTGPTPDTYKKKLFTISVTPPT